jgi:undecaprenyl diphosphate synthase
MTDPELASPGSDEERLLRQIDRERLPAHVALIMDGNGRWAARRRLPRAMGHRAGVRAVRETVEVAARLGIERLTLYAFSRENWRRPPAEVHTLMSLVREYVKKELDELVRNDVRLSLIGCPEDLPDTVREDVERAVRATAANAGLELTIALSYGGRREIVDACRSLLRSGIAPEAIDEREFERHLYAPGMPDPDLLIRTSGELRISNFLLWQIAYSEIWVTDTLWPDFRRKDLFLAILDYQRRERRFGGLGRTSQERVPAAVRG